MGDVLYLFHVIPRTIASFFFRECSRARLRGLVPRVPSGLGPKSFFRTSSLLTFRKRVRCEPSPSEATQVTGHFDHRKSVGAHQPVSGCKPRNCPHQTRTEHRTRPKASILFSRLEFSPTQRPFSAAGGLGDEKSHLDIPPFIQSANLATAPGTHRQDGKERTCTEPKNPPNPQRRLGNASHHRDWSYCPPTTADPPSSTASLLASLVSLPRHGRIDVCTH